VLGVQRLERNRDIERVLVQRLSAATGGEFSVGRVRLGFFSVYLKDVSVSLSIHSFDARVRDIQVAFSLWKLMMTRGDFSRSISKIILISPALDIRLAQLASTGGSLRLPAAEPRRCCRCSRTFRCDIFLFGAGPLPCGRARAQAWCWVKSFPEKSGMKTGL